MQMLLMRNMGEEIKLVQAFLRDALLQRHR
jgi:hypothetical protein